MEKFIKTASVAFIPRDLISLYAGRKIWMARDPSAVTQPENCQNGWKFRYITKLCAKYLQKSKSLMNRVTKKKRRFLAGIDAAVQAEMPLFENILLIQDAR
jgi:hypothetical protein